MEIAVDVDGVLCEEGPWTEHAKAIPIQENIDKVNSLYQEGHIIVIYTGRFLEEQELTEMWLKKYKVKYHKIVMDKLLADVYVDDRSMELEEL